MLRKFAKEFSSDDFKYDVYNNQVNKTVQGLINDVGFDNAYTKLCFLDDYEIDLKELENYLYALVSKDVNILDGNSDLKRLIRIFDFLKNKK